MTARGLLVSSSDILSSLLRNVSKAGGKKSAFVVVHIYQVEMTLTKQKTWILFFFETLLYYTLANNLQCQRRFEKKYDPIPVLDWMRNHPTVPIMACGLYGLFIVLGQYYMKDRPSWNWRSAMAVWNFGLSLFSWIGMARTAPQLMHNLYHMSLRDNLCMDRKCFLSFLLAAVCRCHLSG